MSEPDPLSYTPPPTEHAAAATSVRLPDFYADSPLVWFFCIDAMFAASRITAPLTKFNYSLSKLPFNSLLTASARCANAPLPTDPYQELQDILLRS
jgi:hypothetical protein